MEVTPGPSFIHRIVLAGALTALANGTTGEVREGVLLAAQAAGLVVR